DITPTGAIDTLTMDNVVKGLMIDGRSADGTATSSAIGRSTYVPLILKGGMDHSIDSIHWKNDENSDRVTNLSEDTRDVDLHKLFKLFGHIMHVYVAMDQKTGVSRGFIFVNFVNREDTHRSINKLNGYHYDNLILKVEWATP
ncbi:hypothetical protein KI387_014077, partial [Taxus chinensis]